MSRSPVVPEVGAELDRLWAQLRPQAAKVWQDLKGKSSANISDIEGASVAVGDLLARTLVQWALAQQTVASEAEVAAARAEAVQRGEEKLPPEMRPQDLRVVRQKGRSCALQTLRGPVPYRREYLYFPDLRVGVFPPRPAVRHSGR